MTIQLLHEVIRDWQSARNAAASTDVSKIDAHYARQAGLPVLAALHDLAARLESVGRYTSAAEVLAEICLLIDLATGEAQKRAELAGCPGGVPGLLYISTLPLLEEIATTPEPQAEPDEYLPENLGEQLMALSVDDIVEVVYVDIGRGKPYRVLCHPKPQRSVIEVAGPERLTVWNWRKDISDFDRTTGQLVDSSRRNVFIRPAKG